MTDTTHIAIRGASQHTLKNLDLDIPLNTLTVVTGVSGSGKSTLAFDTLFAEGQRRYIETFSPYVRQFLAQMDRPAVESIEGVPPAVAIEQYNPVRTSRSTVGTMTEINDYLKLLFARHSQVICPTCDVPGIVGNSENIIDDVYQQLADDARIQVNFRLPRPEKVDETTLTELLSSQGYTRFEWDNDYIHITQDRLKLTDDNRSRLAEAVDHALSQGDGQVQIIPILADKSLGEPLKYVQGLSCPSCEKTFQWPTPNTFSYNAPSGACEECKGFGRVMGIDYDLVIPDGSLPAVDAIKPWQTPSNAKFKRELKKFAAEKGIDLQTPWRELSEADKNWIIDGEPNRTGRKKTTWYGVKAFFDYWERKSYKMHVRIQLAKYRSYYTCPVCNGSRLKAESLYWHLPTDNAPETTLGNRHGVTIDDLQKAPIREIKALIDALAPSASADSKSAEQLFTEIARRLDYLQAVGLDYLTLDRQTRTLSGGEVQRINLTTALGSSLTHTLFVLDEPTVGLHAQEVDRIIQIMQRLRDAGNTLVVVEHDPAVMMAADRIIDMGPAAGEAGGEVLFEGTPQALLQADTPTAHFLRKTRRIPELSLASLPGKPDTITLNGIHCHNINGETVSIPLHGMTVITGISGSGKSTLVSNVLYPAYRRACGEAAEYDAEVESITGFDHIRDMVLVDQSPIGKSARSNPISYVGAYDGIRQLFAKLPESKALDFTASTFSFNSGNGRCATCQGTGFEQVEMQFMNDIYLRCPDCDGKRFQAATLAVHYYSPITEQSYNIDDVLNLTVDQAIRVFADQPKILKALQPLEAVGLPYVKLGQPVPTLSGGEAQRLKLAKFLTEKRGKGKKKGAAADGRPTLYILDEPTTGLHLSDVETLLKALATLVEAGDALLLVEHHSDVIQNATHLIELGPGAGTDGGQVIFAGTPAEATAANTPTGKSLAVHLSDQIAEAPADYQRLTAPESISVIQAREHNLKNISVDIPHQQMVAITGVSGSGKSTLAFSILFAEGQRRYLESLNAFSRQFVQPPPRPEVDGLLGMPPAIAIEQRTSRGGQKSTVATITEIYHYLRQIFLLLGTQNCPDCQVPIHSQNREQVAQQLIKTFAGKTATLLAPLVVDRKGLYKELAAWAADQGFETLLVNGDTTPTNDWPQLDRFKSHDISLPVATLTIPEHPNDELLGFLHKAIDLGNGQVSVQAGKGKTATTKHYSTKRACPSCPRSFAELDPRLFSYNSKRGWCTTCEGNGVIETGKEGQPKVICPDCNGARLNEVALAVTFRGRNIADISADTISALSQWFAELELNERERTIAQLLVDEIRARLHFLAEVGLDYLSLDRAAPTLSGGEAQRIRLAAQMGAHMSGACYVLDEPTIGLHARDNDSLITALRELVDQGNSVIVVEHDEATIRAADHIIDIGPGAGSEGGTVVASGNLETICAHHNSRTGQQLSKATKVAETLKPRQTTKSSDALTLVGATLHNLNNVTLSLPLNRLVGVAGVSGSGKSSLIRQVVEPNLIARINNSKAKLINASALSGIVDIGRVLEVDQTPIGRTPRSTPATYIGIWDDIRKQLANTQEARLRGWTIGRFSFNNKEGSCPDCGGQGEIKIEMNFLPDVREPCQRCHGMRFNQETLQVKLRDKSAGEILDLPVDEAIDFFSAHPKVHYALTLLSEVGLGYLKLGQPSSTLSGGEAQRIKLVSELAKAKSRTSAGAPHTVYLLDEPTVGLHMSDVDKLIVVLHKLVDEGHSVVVIEHNTDLLRACDWLIELGPDGGEKGGKIVAAGMPKRLISGKKSTPTLDYLRREITPKAA